MALTSYLSGSFLQKKAGTPLKVTVITGLLAITVSLAATAFFPNIYLLFLALTILGSGTGLVLPSVNTLITSATPTSERGMITCLYGTMRFFGVAIGPPVFGVLASLGHLFLFLFFSLIAFAITAFIFGTLREQKLLPPRLLQEG